MNCDTCAKQDGCSFSGKIGGQGCRAWEGIPAVPACPLPRIGSKEWGWESHYGQGNKPWWSSPHNEYQVDWINGRWGVMGDGDVANRDALCRASCDDLDVAFRIAELLARRDWRKEQGKR